VIVTFDLKHFSPEHLEPWGVQALRPQVFLQSLWGQRSSWGNKQAGRDIAFQRKVVGACVANTRSRDGSKVRERLCTAWGLGQADESLGASGLFACRACT
jgi:hypothetical protein